MADDPPIATLRISVTLADGSLYGREITLGPAIVAAGDIEDGFRRPARLLLKCAFDLIDKELANGN